ncbi:MAG TPA: hypothetical protein DDW90_06040 [Cyanobacteria bacterium UBA9971]|nr:hypothetical protein [Cyanobacteria bacterium UBA9971]
MNNKLISISGVIILYNPELNVIENINSYINYVDILFAIDNSENSNLDIIEKLKLNPKICYISNNENLGIAKALNQGAELALQKNFSWLLTMDQDSKFEDDNAKYFFNCFDKLENSEEIALICANRQSATNFDKTTENIYDFKTALIAITSGNLLNLELYKQIGKFEEKLFIDQVDHDYNLRALLKNYKIIKFKNILINHSLGKQVSVNEKLFIHSPIRIYYQTRNFLYMLSKYFFFFPCLFFRYGLSEIKRIFINFYFDRVNIKAKFRKILEGFRDFILNKYGKYENN